VSRQILIPGLGGIGIFLAIWELLIVGGVFQFDYLPAPSQIAVSLAGMLRSGSVYEEIAHTLAATMIGWFVAFVIGVAAGVVLGVSETARRYSLASIEVLRPLPAVAFIPVALLLFGFSLQTELLVIIIPSLWLVLVNTMGGVAAVPQRLQDVTRAFRLSPFDAMSKVFIPAAAPAVLVGCRLSMTLALVLAIVAEMVGNPEGLGYAVVREAQALQPATMFGYIVITGLLGVGLNALIVIISVLILPGEFLRPSADWQKTR
jgi:sulfonate transport system permease protein